MILVMCRVLLLLCIALPSFAGATTVNVAVPSFSMSLVAFMAAKERGYYRQEGLDVNFVLMPAAIASRALIAGNVDFATVGGSALPHLSVARRCDCFSARSIARCFGFTRDPTSPR